MEVVEAELDKGQMLHKLAAAVAAFWPEGPGTVHLSLPSLLPLSPQGYQWHYQQAKGSFPLLTHYMNEGGERGAEGR